MGIQLINYGKINDWKKAIIFGIMIYLPKIGTWGRIRFKI